MNTLIYINLDGFSYSYYLEAKKRNKTRIFDLLINEGVLLSDLHTNIISITNPMQSAILSGCYTNRTHNFYFHFDYKTKEIVRHKRYNSAQNIVQSLKSEGKKAISIHQFMLENQGCIEGNYDYAYIKTSTPSNYKLRFNILQDLISGNPVISGDQEFVYNNLPSFIALYIDDLDSLGHNQQDYFDYPIRSNYEDRIDDIIDCIEKIQFEIEKTINLAKARGIYDQLTFLVTTDHGMTKFSGDSKIYKLQETLINSGYKTCLANQYDNNADLILLPITIETHLYYNRVLNPSEEQRLISILSDIDYIDRIVLKEELVSTHELCDYGPDMIISPKVPHYFHHQNYAKGLTRGSHDTLDITSNHIFGLMWGNNIVRNKIYHDKCFNKDLIPTLCYALDFKLPNDANGSIIKNIIKK